MIILLGFQIEFSLNFFLKKNSKTFLGKKNTKILSEHNFHSQIKTVCYSLLDALQLADLAGLNQEVLWVYTARLPSCSAQIGSAWAGKVHIF